MRAALVLVALLSTPAAPAAANCYEDAAARYGLGADLLRAVERVESGGRQVSRRNTDGSEDVCAMQINTFHAKRLAALGIERGDLLADRCLCLHVGAWILAEEVSRVGYTWRAVAQYHSRRPDLQAAYVAKVRAALAAIKQERDE